MSNNQKLKTNEIIWKLEHKINEIELDRDELIEELNDNETNEDINDEIYELWEDIYLYTYIIKKLHKKNEYKKLLKNQWN